MKRNLITDFYSICATILLATTAASFAQTHAYTWDATNGLRDLGTLGGDSFAYAINDSGTVVGTYIPLDKFYYHGFIWTEATGMVDLGIPGGGHSRDETCVPVAINSQGNVVGYGRQADGEQVAFYWTPTDGFTILSTYSCTCDSANAGYSINDFNQVTGSLRSHDPHAFILHAFLWSPDMVEPRDLGTLAGADVSIGYGINNRSQIAGVSGSLMFWSMHTGMRSLGLIDGSLYVQPYAINDAGEIVGLNQTGAMDQAFYTGRGVGLKFLKGLGGNSMSAHAINQAGAIVGYATDSLGVAHGVMWPTASSDPIIVPLGNCYGINNSERIAGWN
jgi:probable HAF family extracellular repeat protein